MSQCIRRTSIPQELAAGRSVTYFTVGVSMQPLLAERSTHVTIAPLQQARNRDILLYIRPNGQLVLHRLIRQDAQYYYLRGDNTYGLEQLPRERAIGVVTHVFRKDRQIDVQTSAAYKCYAALWTALYPLRRLWRLTRLAARKLAVILHIKPEKHEKSVR